MSETYPVLINGEKKGTLTVSREGLTTRFDAKCEDPGTLVRLSVYGGGKEGYLGVMTPENGVLTRSRAEYLCAGAQAGDRADAGEETGDGSGTGRVRPSRAEAARARGGYRLARRRGREFVHGV